MTAFSANRLAAGLVAVVAGGVRGSSGPPNQAGYKILGAFKVKYPSQHNRHRDARCVGAGSDALVFARGDEGVEWDEGIVFVGGHRRFL